MGGMPSQEFTEEHLPGALNIPLDHLDKASVAQLDKRRAVVVYCWDGL
jgi:rhodanese-related sulfurtransferase